jgi:lipoprotein-releasing system permease protein
MSLPRSIALRFLKASKWQTLFIILGISVGVAIQVFIGVLITSLQRNIVDDVIGNSSQITILSDNGAEIQIEDYDEIMDDLKDYEELTAISAAQDSSALTNASDKTTSIFVRGLDFDDADDIYEISDRIIEGKKPKEDNEVIIGKELSKELDLEVDDKFYIQVAAKAIDQEVEITGIYDFNAAAINELWVIMTLDSAQEIFVGGNDTVTSIETQVGEDYYFDADVIAETIEKDLDNDDIKVTNWIDQNEDLQSGLQAQSTSSYFIQAFAIISVIIGVSSVLSITVLQKNRQLGILKAMGITNRDASKIFLYQGLFFGIGGSIGGILLGIFLLFGFSFSSSVLTIIIDPIFLIISAAIVTTSAVIASLSPALKSSKVDPIDIIRGE